MLADWETVSRSLIVDYWPAWYVTNTYFHCAIVCLDIRQPIKYSDCICNVYTDCVADIHFNCLSLI